jgi:hypothetical protein
MLSSTSNVRKLMILIAQLHFLALTLEVYIFIVYEMLDGFHLTDCLLLPLNLFNLLALDQVCWSA